MKTTCCPKARSRQGKLFIRLDLISCFNRRILLPFTGKAQLTFVQIFKWTAGSQSLIAFIAQWLDITWPSTEKSAKIQWAVSVIWSVSRNTSDIERQTVYSLVRKWAKHWNPPKLWMLSLVLFERLWKSWTQLPVALRLGMRIPDNMKAYWRCILRNFQMGGLKEWTQTYWLPAVAS